MYRIIQVGVGGYGSSWLATVEACHRAQYVALVDINATHLAAAREKTGVPESVCFSRVEDALAAVTAWAANEVSDDDLSSSGLDVVDQESAVLLLFRLGEHVVDPLLLVGEPASELDASLDPPLANGRKPFW